MELKLLSLPSDSRMTRGRSWTFRVQVVGEGLPDVPLSSYEDERGESEENPSLLLVRCQVSGLDYVIINSRRCNQAFMAAKSSQTGGDLTAGFRIEPHGSGDMIVEFSLVGHEDTTIKTTVAVCETNRLPPLEPRFGYWAKGRH